MNHCKAEKNDCNQQTVIGYAYKTWPQSCCSTLGEMADSRGKSTKIRRMRNLDSGANSVTYRVTLGHVLNP